VFKKKRKCVASNNTVIVYYVTMVGSAAEGSSVNASLTSLLIAVKWGYKCTMVYHNCWK
jgi:hypothetical protein